MGEISRRSMLFLVPILAGLKARAVALASVRLPRIRSADLASVRRWGCQYQNIDVALLAATPLDMVVIDQSVDGKSIKPSDMEALRWKQDGGRRLVLAYLSVGEAESYRPYWSPEWRDLPPPWLGPENAQWPGSFAVRFWHPAWRDLLFEDEGSLLNGIIKAGFDGAFLDRVDAYGDWPDRREEAEDEMIHLVDAIARHSREHRENFLLIGQNAEPLLRSEAYRSAIDAVSKESLLYNLSSDGEPNAASDIAWSMSYLEVARQAGLPIFAIEYLSDPAKIGAARRRFDELGFIPWFGNRLIDRLPI
jgi:cysteinyl-tRNA synthetase